VNAEPSPPLADVPLVDVKDLVTHFPVRRHLADTLGRRPRRLVRAVDGVTFAMHAGEFVAIVGESGCGKTTTVQTMLGMVSPTSGRVVFNGCDITALKSRAMRPFRRRIQMVYQDPYESLDPRFRVRQVIEEPMLIHGVGDSKTMRRNLVFESLERAGLTPPELYTERFPHELSGGQRQRVSIAASLVLDPHLLVADEPVSMLDVSVRAGVLSLLDGLRSEGSMGVLMITHDLSTAAHFADRIEVMYLGRIVEEGASKEVVEHPLHPYTKALLSVVPKRDPRRQTRPQILQGETPNPVNIPSGCRFHPRCPVAVAECRETDPTLRPERDGASPLHTAACVLV
jgi:oligopeptide/dipeptide ABC transporter ATP-binding protein